MMYIYVVYIESYIICYEKNSSWYFLLFNPPNHLQVEPRYYHVDGSKITLHTSMAMVYSTMAVAVKIQSYLKKLKIAKFIQNWKKEILLPSPWYYHSHGSSVILLPSPW